MARTLSFSEIERPALSVRALGRGARGWIFLIPALVFFVGWQLLPILQALRLSFTNFAFLVNTPTRFVGFANYVQALRDPLVGVGLLRAAEFTAIFLPGMIGIPLFIAVLLDRVQNRSLATVYRLTLLMPAMIPGPLIFVLWKMLYSSHVGPIDNLLINPLHLVTVGNAPDWLGDPNFVFISVAVMEWWWGIGFHTLFFLAGLASIPHEIYDAARVDGANEWRLFWHVTIHRLRPILLILTVLRFGTAMAVIQEYLIFGGFNRSLPTYTWTVYMWDLAFNTGNWDQGYAAAVGWIGAVVMLVVVVGLFWVFRPRD